MLSPPSNGLLSPPLINTSPLSSPTSSRVRSPSGSSQNSFLAPASPVSSTLDGETLRTSRSGSFRSYAETAHSSEHLAAKRVDSNFEEGSLCTEDALSPDPGTEDDFVVHDNPFAFSPGQLNKLLNPKSLAALRALGGIKGLEKGLVTDVKAGLSQDETAIQHPISFQEATGAEAPESKPSRKTAGYTPSASSPDGSQYPDRCSVYKKNRLPAKKPVTFWHLLWRAYNDRILMLLTGAAVIALALGIYEVVSDPGSVDWIEGVAIVVAILIVVLVTALSDYRREREFARLNARKEDRQVKVIRSGKTILVSIYDVMVGDVCHLEAGDILPADGVLINGHGVTCDESSATGESDVVRKHDAAFAADKAEKGTVSEKLDPFIISGTKVAEGLGTFLATSVGPNSSYGKIMISLQDEVEPTPLQVKLGKLANWIGSLGGAAAGLLFTVLFIRFLVGLSTNQSSPAHKATEFLDILIVAVTIIVVAVPEGLPLSVLLALSFATKKMYKDNNLVRHLRACETMGNCTTICSDKTGTLTQNNMAVVGGVFGPLESNHLPGLKQIFETASPSFRDLLLQSIIMNSTATESYVDGANIFLGSKTETALLAMAKDHLGLGPLAEGRAAIEVVSVIPFDSTRKFSGVVVRISDGRFRLFIKGAAEIMLRQASKEITNINSDALETCHLSVKRRNALEELLYSFADRSLRTIALLYADFEEWSPEDQLNKRKFSLDNMSELLTFVGLVGIQDPLREEVPVAVNQCQTAGIKVRMVTGDNVKTATAIATSCGIMTEGGIVIEGPDFRKLSSAEMDEILPRLEVLARSSPEDKRVLVANLKQRGETVAVTGDGTNDAPALKTGDVGFSMGIAGTEVAKSASDIILLDDNFSSIVKAIMWGRAVNDAVQKFLQFQVTVNIAAVILAFVSAVYSPQSQSVLTAVQLLWINLVMDTFAALALATDPARESLLDRPPSPKSAPLITANMWKMIVGQAAYQLAVTFVLYFAGARILGYDASNHDQQAQLDTTVFNTFVWMQIFNMFNNRRLDNKFNIFEGLQHNLYFMGILCIMVAGQVLIIFVGNVAFQIVALNGTQWGVSLLCAVPCLIWALLLRCIPDRYAAHAVQGVSFALRTILKPVVELFAWISRYVGRLWQRFRKLSVRKSKKEGEIGTAVSSDEERGFASPLSPTSNPPPITLTTLD